MKKLFAAMFAVLLSASALAITPRTTVLRPGGTSQATPGGPTGVILWGMWSTNTITGDTFIPLSASVDGNGNVGLFSIMSPATGAVFTVTRAGDWNQSVTILNTISAGDANNAGKAQNMSVTSTGTIAGGSVLVYLNGGTSTVNPGNTANTTAWLWTYTTTATSMPVPVTPTTSGAQVPFSMSQTGEWDATQNLSDTKTGIVAIDCHGTKKLTLTYTIVGSQGATLFWDCSNAQTAPNAYDPDQWCQLTPGGVVIGNQFNLTAANGAVNAPPITIPSGYRWIRLRTEATGNWTWISCKIHGTQ